MADEKKRAGLGTWLILSIFLLSAALFLVYPVGYSIRRAFYYQGRPTLAFFKILVTDPIVWGATTRSLALAIVSTLGAFVLAMPLAFWSVRYRFPFRNVLSGLLLVPMILPPFVGAIGVKQFLARFGSVNLILLKLGVITMPIDWLGSLRFWGVCALEILHLYPIMYLNLTAALANVDPSLEEAARASGTSGWTLFRRITLPLIVPGIFAGSAIVFIWALTDLGTPLIFGYRRVLAVQIFDQLTEIAINPQPFAMVVFILALTLVLFYVSKRVMISGTYSMEAKGAGSLQERVSSGWRGLLISAAFALVILLALIPHVGVFLTALEDRWFLTVLPESYTLKHFGDALSHPLTVGSIRNSIVYSSLSALIDVVFGCAIAYILVRRSVPGGNVIDAISMLPLALPGLVLAFGYVGAFAKTTLDPMKNPVPLLIVSYAIRRFPYAMRAAYAGFQQLTASLEEASQGLGASWVRTFRRISLPLVSANLIAGGILAFSFAMLEVSDSLILAFKEQYFPIAKAIYTVLQRLGDGPYIACALGIWAMLLLAWSILAAGVFLGKRMGEIFRA